MLSSKCKTIPPHKRFLLIVGCSSSLHATSPTPHGASRLVQANVCPFGEKTRRVLRPGVVGMRGSMVIRLRPCFARVLYTPSAPFTSRHTSRDTTPGWKIPRPIRPRCAHVLFSFSFFSPLFFPCLCQFVTCRASPPGGLASRAGCPRTFRK